MSQKYKFVHACIRVLDLDKSIKFYEDALGMQVSRRRDYPEYKFTLVYMKLPGDNFELELTYNYDRQEPYTIGDGYSHFAVVVDDLEASYKRHKEAGYTVGNIKKLSGEASGGYYFLTDPDGYRTEIIQE
ncbi:Glyoxalase/bleomycin resistance protein/dioxygenase [Desulfotomaculum nigrificans CO-1-SRB]|uniref:Aldoketomutase n=1 Tax=Desulfotomaculum nigrificans (strain DSM 14880 / VKM B-2319 / CO-1-SRB) TaxID=868595 RepID=F6B906_DESCC|nr:VOC family protein [Desulfotomaculum nigrificans]AEF93657.1 Glyoxalase/bleomycin resistance protein/dioxygenase [Desulfotomaculum nigrificans CO-1-SRB]